MRFKGLKSVNRLLFSCSVNDSDVAAKNRPITFNLFLTTRCNYRCKVCYQREYNTDIDFEYIKAVAPFFKHADNVGLIGGEPLLYRNLSRVLKLAISSECTITMVTNGSLLTAEISRQLAPNVRWISFSIDAATKRTYSHLRGGDLNKVLSNIECFSSVCGGSATIKASFLAMASNIDELSDFILVCSSVGIGEVDVSFPVLSECLKSESVESCKQICMEQFGLAKDVADHCGIRLNLPSVMPREDVGFHFKVCTDPWHNFSVGVDGRVIVCCDNFVIGSLSKQSFQDVWNSSAAAGLRETVNSNTPLGKCRMCRYRSS